MFYSTFEARARVLTKLLTGTPDLYDRQVYNRKDIPLGIHDQKCAGLTYSSPVFQFSIPKWKSASRISASYKVGPIYSHCTFHVGSATWNCDRKEERIMLDAHKSWNVLDLV